MTKRVAISLPDDLFDDMERARSREGLDRSSWLQALIRERFKGRTRAEKIARYVEGYRRFPETADDLAWADAAARELFAPERPEHAPSVRRARRRR